jgi:hypothetical protein
MPGDESIDVSRAGLAADFGNGCEKRNLDVNLPWKGQRGPPSTIR